ncbi:MAG TPA: phosphoribosyltransferase [Elusimicrobia bacterium]|nr:MAG: hypothetical protein A2X37_09010 [Elusimicrobia bacterium GWA2_66_18]OGR71759.1 MAG: hypothetical protein A2X40_05385 [Elusimicrobia bacterium GWC2_65_9]HAZ09199.1 phosphoribosyltransferase [Elusimicrobiota bacterium]
MFRDRLDAAGRLAAKLQRYRDRKDALILAVPRGGLPIGGVLARELGLKLDVILTKKIGHPVNPEFAIGAVSLTDAAIDAALIERERIPSDFIASSISRIRESLRRRYRMYRGAARPLPVAGKTVILTDDGAATGRTLLAAIELLRSEGAGRIVAALPVAPPDTVRVLERGADEVVCLEAPGDFMAIGQFYEDFSQVTDEEAIAILRENAPSARPP